MQETLWDFRHIISKVCVEINYLSVDLVGATLTINNETILSLNRPNTMG